MKGKNYSYCQGNLEQNISLPAAHTTIEVEFLSGPQYVLLFGWEQGC